ncbi:MAG: thymidine phosphorylase, partial [Eubacteriales bacterium]
MQMCELIRKKRSGIPLSREEIDFIVDGFTRGEIPDYQMSAFCMAVVFRGMDDRETADLTSAMANSGDMLDLSRFGKFSADKHSTGGVGDKTSLIVGPIVAACGGTFAKMSGRGLGHTGGTVDKLESIKGYKTSLSAESFLSQAEKTGIAIIGQTGNLAPADKKLYALRDVTETVDSIPLIVSSVMSKKIAAGAMNIVLDVKSGSGAFMKDAESAKTLARKMVDIGKACGRNISAVISDMDVPLGYAVGNSLEVKEAIYLLRGGDIPDLREICLALSSELIAMIFGISVKEAEKRAENALISGAAYEKFMEWICAQGAELSENGDIIFPNANIKYDVVFEQEGYISHMNAELIGRASSYLGAGRKKKDDLIDLSAGIILKKKTGDHIRKGEVAAEFYTSSKKLL